MSGRAHAVQLAARLGDRDLAILASLREFRLMTGAQLRRLHFPGGQFVTQARKARAALQRLTALRVVVRLDRRVGGVRAGSEGHIYSLSGRGYAVLALDQAIPRRHGRIIDTKIAFQSHVLAVSQLAVELREQERTGVCVVEELRAEPGAWRWFSGIGGGRRVLKPDAYVRLAVGEYVLSHFIEIDQATESLPTITRKCAVYVDYWRSGQEQRMHGVFPRIWWLVPNAARLTAITAAIRRLPADTHAVFAVALASDAHALLTQLDPQGGAR
ncbi:MAG TPA: replication-relaxation family protein [Pseudonocardiaceae bacterium]|nr:replication-relaxation family protein [Pseudonocardiaceae bacterium]